MSFSVIYLSLENKYIENVKKRQEADYESG